MVTFDQAELGDGLFLETYNGSYDSERFGFAIVYAKINSRDRKKIYFAGTAYMSMVDPDMFVNDYFSGYMNCTGWIDKNGYSYIDGSAPRVDADVTEWAYWELYAGIEKLFFVPRSLLSVPMM